MITKIYNLDDCPLSIKNGVYGGMAGHKDGIVWNDACWLVKYPKNIRGFDRTGGASYSTAPLSEYLGSQIYKILGYEVHETHLAERNGKIVVACKDFATDGNTLLEIRTIKNHANSQMSELFEREFTNTGSAHSVDLEELLLHLNHNPILSQIPGIRDRFWEQAVVDIFINNSDRNNGNWGVLRSPSGKDSLSPIFDNGGCMQPNISDEKASKVLQDICLCIKNASNTQTTYATNGHLLSSKKFLNLAPQYPELQSAILKIVPLINSHLPEIEQLVKNIPSKHTMKDGRSIDVCSETRKSLYLIQMKSRLQDLLIPAYKAALQSRNNGISEETAMSEETPIISPRI